MQQRYPFQQQQQQQQQAKKLYSSSSSSPLIDRTTQQHSGNLHQSATTGGVVNVTCELSIRENTDNNVYMMSSELRKMNLKNLRSSCKY